MTRLQKIKTRLKSWNKEVFGDLRLIESALQKRLKELDREEGSGNWSDDLRQERMDLKKELNEILVKQEILILVKQEILVM